MATKDAIIWLDKYVVTTGYKNEEENTIQNILKQALNQGTPPGTKTERKQNMLRFINNNTHQWRNLSQNYNTLKQEVTKNNRKYLKQTEKEIDQLTQITEIENIRINLEYKKTTIKNLENTKRARINLIQTEEKNTQRKMQQDIQKTAEAFIISSKGKLNKEDAIREATELITKQFERRKAIGI